uniref:Fe2OG dioxygenase domain-containing protein n=1 Tax=Oryza punctata TaxID=4537 RepID=A0A0E0MAM6_ORYPU
MNLLRGCPRDLLLRGGRRTTAMAHARTTGSLPVANVQALAETCNDPDQQIPERYIRADASADEVISGGDCTAAIPTIDLSKLLDPLSSDEETEKLGSACQQWGFFQLINHGVPEDVIGDVRRDIAEFFRLPLETKKTYSQLPNSIDGYGQAFVVSEEQKLDWADMFYLVLRPGESRNMTLWPAQPPSFRNSIDRYSSETARVARCLFEFMAKDMGVRPESLLERFQDQPQGIRMNYYPPCREAGKVVGLSPHTDAAGLTLLLQVNDVPGLQIRSPGGRWLAVSAPPDGAFVVNVGDIFEIMSNGKYRSVEHRAVVRPDRERVSAAVFHRPFQDTVVGPLPELVGEGGGSAASPIDGCSYPQSVRVGALEVDIVIYGTPRICDMDMLCTSQIDEIANCLRRLPSAQWEEQARETKLTMSLQVPNVQELARSCNRPGQQIPDRYIRPEAGTDEVISGQDINTAIPVIDLAKLLNPQSSQEECAKLGSACQHWGFFQLVNHGVPDDVISDVRRDLTEFFRLPLEAKEAYAKPPDKYEGYGQHFVVSEKQKLDWGDLLHLRLRPTESRDLRFWPAHPSSFRNSMERYSSEMAKVARCLLEFLAMDMGVDPESLLEVFRGQPQSMRVNYYPPCRQTSKVLGLSPHCDATSLTLLLHVNDVQGLQIRKDGKWLTVEALDGAFVVNLGDMLEILSNGRYMSVEHRAMVHPEKERISAAVFHQACRDAMVGPLPELVTKDGGRPVYKSMAYEDFMKRFFSAKLDGRANVEGMKI